MTITCPDFKHSGTIPSEYTCDGDDVNPPLDIEDVPKGAETMALLVDDTDAPGKTWVHWIAFNIPIGAEIRRDSVPGIEGRNDFDQRSYGGPCPPSGAHRYYFKLYALDTRLDLKAGCSNSELLRAMEGHILDHAELIGLYSRS